MLSPRIFGRLAVGFCLATFPLLAEEDALKSETRTLLSFEQETDLANITTLSSQFSGIESGEGNRALRVVFLPENAYPNINFRQQPASDFRGYGGILFDLYNPGTETVAFGVRVDSSDEADGNGKHSRSGRGAIEGGQRATFIMPFGIDPAAVGMKSLPGFGSYRSLGMTGKGPFDLGHIVTWQIFMGRPAKEMEVIVDNVRLAPGEKQDFTGLIDRFGQFSRADWPGKIHELSDFATQKAEEEVELKRLPRLKGMDQYGGWADGPQLKATGFFRVEKYKDKWAFVDPEGRLFLSFGPTTVNASSTTLVTGRETMFQTLGEEDPVLAKTVAGTEKKTVDFLVANMQRKYGEDFKKAWFSRTYDRLPSWGLNTIGAFSSWEVFGNGKVPYTATIWPAANHARISTGKEQVRAMDDPFDPKFAEDVTTAVRAQASRIKNDPFCIGYFVGNEEHWGYSKGGLKSYYTLVLHSLSKPAAESPAKRAFLDILKSKYSEVSKLNEAWGRKFENWGQLESPLEFAEPWKAEIREDFSLLLNKLAEEYFRTVRDSIRKEDPNHLYLGCRFAGYSPEVLAAAAKYSDVLSFNVYRLKVEPSEWSILDAYDKPVLIGEFHFCASDRGVFDTGLVGVANQEERGKAYQTYIKSVLALPKFVGAHWFQYTDQPTTGRPMDGENGNVGFVSNCDTPYPELIQSAREIHQEMYTLRFGGN